MTQLSLFPLPSPSPGKEILKQFTYWRDARDYAKNLPADIWDIWILRPDDQQGFVVRAVRK